jgi:hypothetical protein
MANTFYGIGFNESGAQTLTVVPTNCTVTNVTASTNAQSVSLAEPWRVTITGTGANPYLTIAGSSSPAVQAQRRRIGALLGVRIVSSGAPVVWLGNASHPQVFQVPLRENISSTDPGPYGNFAMTLDGLGGGGGGVLRVSIETGEVVTMDIGRYWLSDMARVYGGPFEEWTDGGSDSGRMVETDGFQGLGFELSTRNAFEVPLSVMTEIETYAGVSPGVVTGYASIKAMTLSAGTHDQIIAGGFSQIATGVYAANSSAYGVDALTYARLAEMPKIQRIGGPTYATNLSILELK